MILYVFYLIFGAYGVSYAAVSPTPRNGAMSLKEKSTVQAEKFNKLFQDKADAIYAECKSPHSLVRNLNDAGKAEQERKAQIVETMVKQGKEILKKQFKDQPLADDENYLTKLCNEMAMAYVKKKEAEENAGCWCVIS